MHRRQERSVRRADRDCSRLFRRSFRLGEGDLGCFHDRLSAQSRLDALPPDPQPAADRRFPLGARRAPSSHPRMPHVPPQSHLQGHVCKARKGITEKGLQIPRICSPFASICGFAQMLSRSARCPLEMRTTSRIKTKPCRPESMVGKVFVLHAMLSQNPRQSALWFGDRHCQPVLILCRTSRLRTLRRRFRR